VYAIHIRRPLISSRVPVSEFHSLGTLSTEFSGDNDFASLGRRFHDESDNTVTRTTDSKSSQQFEFEGFGLGLGTQSSVLDAFGIQLDGTVGESESLLNDTGQFTNAATVFSQNVLGTGGSDNDFGTVGSRTDLNSSITVFGQFGNQEFVEFGVKDTIGNKLALARHSAVS